MDFLTVFLIAAVLGVVPGAIAQSKGRSFGLWWLYGAALFIVALPHSLVISKDATRIEREQLQSGTSRKCPFCAEIIKAEAIVCRFCGRDLPKDAVPQVERVAVTKEPEPVIDNEELDRRMKAWKAKR